MIFVIGDVRGDFAYNTGKKQAKISIRPGK